MATDIEKMRVLIPDNEMVYDGNYLFDEADLNAYIDVANGNVLRAAGYAIMAIATSEALISKVIKTQDLSTNGAAVAEALRKNAERLFDRADKEDDAKDAFYFDIVDYGYPWSRPELTEFSKEW